MMNSVTGLISALEMNEVAEKTQIRINNASELKTPEALIMHEQSILDDKQLLVACSSEYKKILYTPRVTYVPQEIIKEFEKYEVMVIAYDVESNTVLLGVMPEFANQVILTDKYMYKLTLVPIYYYVEWRTKQYGSVSFVNDLAPKDIWDFIVSEAVKRGASDITVTNTRDGAAVYYNIRKNKVHSRRRVSTGDVESIARILATSAGATLADLSAKPRFFSVDLDRKHRGRVVINRTIRGMLITVRVLSNEALNKSMESLNLTKPTAEFVRKYVLSKEKGLRLFIGETMSGKNTSILSALNEIVVTDRYKVVSIEQPVEIFVDGIEQINAETDEEFAANADSLLRQNPDYVYFTEITARTAEAIMQQSNTAKAVFSTIHANSISDVLFRLQDITGMPMDRLILTMHSCVYQELVRDDVTDTVRPYNRCVYFSEELKMRLYGQSTAIVKKILAEEERKWDKECNAEIWGGFIDA